MGLHNEGSSHNFLNDLKEGLDDYKQDGNQEKLRELLLNTYLEINVQYVLKRVKAVSREEVISQFFDATGILMERMRTGEFLIRDEKGVRAYLCQVTINKVREYKRRLRGDHYLVSPEEFSKYEQIIQTEFEEDIDTEYDRIRERYGIDLGRKKSDEKLPSRVVEAFHLLSDKCKFLVFMRCVLKLKHSEISNSLGFFYKVASSDVSKVEFHRCREKFIEAIKEVSNNE